jgi:hypothetical protein
VRPPRYAATSRVADDVGLVVLRVDAELDLERGPALARLARDEHGLAGRELAVEARGADADALLAARLLQPMELGAVEELGEDLGDLCLDDSGPVVFDDDAKAGRGPGSDRGLRFAGLAALAGGLQRRGRRLADLDEEIRQDARLFAGVERVVDGLFHRRQQRLRGVVEAEQVAVLGEELADRDLPLLGRHRLGGRAALRSGRLVDRRRLERRR